MPIFNFKLNKYVDRAKKNDPSLTYIDLSNKFIGNAGAAKLASALAGNTHVTEVDLDINNIGDEGAMSVASALLQNSSLQRLSLGINSIGDRGAESLASALRQNSILQQLRLSNNSIGDEGAALLASALKENSALQGLSLGDNSIGTEGATSLSSALKENSTLQRLSLQNYSKKNSNFIGDGGAMSLGSALQQNSTLQKLDLENNRIGDEGAASLASGIQRNSTLRCLNLYKNNFGDGGVASLASALKQNSTLQTLSLDMNYNISDRGAQSLVSALRYNHTITYIPTYSTKIDIDLRRKKNRLVEINKAADSPAEAASQKEVEFGPLDNYALTTLTNNIYTIYEETGEDSFQTRQGGRPIPDAFRCHLTNQVMEDPVTDPEGTSYERSAILDWMKKNGNKSPTTGNPLTAGQLYWNRALKAIILQEKLLLDQSLEGSIRRFDAKIRSGWTRLADMLPLGPSYHPLPEGFYCPITQELINVPVIDPNGHTYERSAILQWLNSNGTSPVTRSPLRADQLYPNVALEDLIDEEKGRTDESIHPSIRRWRLSGEAQALSPSPGEPSPQDPPNEPAAEDEEQENFFICIRLFCCVLAVLFFLGSTVVGIPYVALFFVFVSICFCKCATRRQ